LHAEEYGRLWLQLYESVAGAANAWVFVNTTDPERYTEFVEWQSLANDTIIERSSVAKVWHALNAAFPYEDSDTWQAASF
jgi:hypothetical protein